MKVLGPNQVGKGILIEMDAGYVDPKDKLNYNFILSFLLIVISLLKNHF